MSNPEQFLWVEKYRPSSIEECILPKAIKQQFLSYVEQKNIPNLLLAGNPGMGKTTAAIALVKSINADYIILNGSLQRNIDTLRTDVTQFASTESFIGGRKYVIIDEADYLNLQSTQPALRGFIEDYSRNCGFIFTVNHADKLMKPLHSRFTTIDFIIPHAEKMELAKEFLARLCYILEEEGAEYDRKVLAQLITQYFPDWRRCIGQLQGAYNFNGKITTAALTPIHSVEAKKLWEEMKAKNFSAIRKRIAEDVSSDPIKLMREVYDEASNYITPQSMPILVTVIARYQYQSAFAADQEINTTAALAEIMMQVEFK